MGNAAKNREVRSIIPKEIGEVFDEVDIERTWDYLEKVFHLNKSKWRSHFEDHYTKSTREHTKVELFVRYGKEHLEPPICQILFRDQFKSQTWFRLIRFIVKDKIKQKEDEANAVKEMYGRSTRYKIHNHQY